MKTKSASQPKRSVAHTDFFHLPAPTADGEFRALYSQRGLAGLDFPGRGTSPLSADKSSVPRAVKRWHQATTRALAAALAGRSPAALPPLDFSHGTAFQQKVWRALMKIRAGRTQSYGEIAAEIGRPNAVRAVGGACGANPWPVLIPCHRVLAANRKLGGFSGGLDWKIKLLAREGVAVDRAV